MQGSISKSDESAGTNDTFKLLYNTEEFTKSSSDDLKLISFVKSVNAFNAMSLLQKKYPHSFTFTERVFSLSTHTLSLIELYQIEEAHLDLESSDPKFQLLSLVTQTT
ncbi:hypothetical protein MtrunA17_Chr1g0172801 [Medicago truncatula]|uniref:Uncharacterized protein n=1 Tax=Medicago truncatula TaxID=3880 RepID=A0A072TFH1_MEDTR|nr:hypothetical protein MTR_0421s0020 [Medicago truncatula]RHN79060.1 hypothetical protein MtrunA17_Chr1g0172801 [Medicago truncatula]